MVGTSVSTVRRDLDLLESRGRLKRTHGGARSTSFQHEEYAFSAKATSQLAEKEAIGEACAALIQPNQTVIVDAGTTCFHVARYLEAKSPHIVTNSLPVAQHFAGSNNLEVVVSGGLIYPKLGVLVGPLAVAAFGQVQADVAILSCGGLTPEGITNSHSLLIEIQQTMIHAARQVILCVDHTKFGRQSISRLCGLEVIDVLIADSPPPDDIAAVLARHEVRLIVAAAGGKPVDSSPAAPSEMEASAAHVAALPRPPLRRLPKPRVKRPGPVVPRTASSSVAGADEEREFLD